MAKQVRPGAQGPGFPLPVHPVSPWALHGMAAVPASPRGAPTSSSPKPSTNTCK